MNGFGISDTGRGKQTNQDNIIVINEPIGALKNLYAVADGMGGHLAGDTASKMAVASIAGYINSQETGDELTILENAVKHANMYVYQDASKNAAHEGMGTTLVMATVSEGTAYIVNVGDSRAYAINASQNLITQLTVDHSFVGELFASGKITKEEAENHPKRHMITRALGTSHGIFCDMFTYKMEKDDIMLLCSDGLTNMLTNTQILDICVKKTAVKEKVAELVRKANDYGGYDNISAILYM